MTTSSVTSAENVKMKAIQFQCRCNVPIVLQSGPHLRAALLLSPGGHGIL